MVKIIKITKAVAQERLADVLPEKEFWCSDGRIIKSLSGLEAALTEMSDETYRYHSNEAKSDFSKWVGEVIGDEKLSRDLYKSKTRAQAAKAVADRIAWLKTK